MKHPLEIKDEVIVRAINKQFGISIDNLEFIPEGENSWLYSCINTETKKRLVIKIQKKPRIAVSQISVELFRAGYRYMPQPYLTVKGGIWGKYKKYYYSVQDFFDPGENNEIFELDDKYLPRLGAALRALHGTNIQPKSLSKLRHETYAPDKYKDLVKFIKLADKGKLKKYPEIQNAVNENKQLIQDVLQDGVSLGQEMKKLQLPLVLVHGDVHPYNILRPSREDVIIADWESCRVAHAEEDLMYFDDRQIRLISKEYGRDLLKNRAAIDFYRRHLDIRTLYFFGYELGVEGSTDKIRARGLDSFNDYISKLKRRD